MESLKLSSVVKDESVRKRVVAAIRTGKVLIYPTDTIYGIGCNAEIGASVDRIRDAKGRDGAKNFSVIAPGKEWIWKNAKLSDVNRDLADKLLPGPYTIIAAAAGSAPKPVVSEDKTIGIRLPRHDFTKVIEEAGVPFVTTSVNLMDKSPARSLKEVPEAVRKMTDIAIDDGVIDGQASRLFDFRTDEVKTIVRR